MTNKGLFLKVLLNRTSEADLSPLPSEEREFVAAAHQVAANDLMPLLQQKSQTLKRWHYSWLAPFLQPLKQNDRQAFMFFFSGAQQKGVALLLHTTPVTHTLAPLLEKFYKFHLFPLVKWEAVLPLEYLPKSPFNQLLNLPKNDLLKLIDLLGFYDLAHEMRRIVAKKTLKDIYSCLTPKEQIFLRGCLHAKDNVVTPNLHLEEWNGDKKTLMALLHRRGITRLSIALSGQHPDLIWHLAHALDTGRGHLLQKNTKSAKIHSLSDAVGLQVENALHNLSKRNIP